MDLEIKIHIKMNLSQIQKQTKDLLLFFYYQFRQGQQGLYNNKIIEKKKHQQERKMYNFNPGFCQPFFINQMMPGFSYFNYQYAPMPINPIKMQNIILPQNDQIENPVLESKLLKDKVFKTQASLNDNVKAQFNDEYNSMVKVQKKKKVKKQKIAPKQKKIIKFSKKVQSLQKQGRNSHSNILRKFFKLLAVQNELKIIVQRIIDKYRFLTSSEQFFIRIAQKGIDYRNYIRVKQVEWIFKDHQDEACKITRILFRNYLNNFYLEHLLSSRKTDIKSIAFHLRGRRSIQDQISGVKNAFDYQIFHE